MKKLLDIVIPITEADLQSTLSILPYWEKYLPIKKLVFIGNDKLRMALENYPCDRVHFINEEKILTIQEVKGIIADITDNDVQAIKRAGWYLQQFLKMGYGKYCEDDYYLVWDADTAPLKDVDMFDSGCPVFDIKTEEHPPFFHTIENLFADMHKAIQGSFVAEHMLIRCDIMKAFIQEVEDNTSLPGIHWYEKILRAVEKRELSYSGFSEFETYGTYCTLRYPGQYKLRDWKSCREGNSYFNAGDLTQKEQKWLAKEFDAISFEKWQQKDSFMFFFRCSFLQSIVSYSRLKRIFDKIFIWKVAYSRKYGKNRKAK